MIGWKRCRAPKDEHGFGRAAGEVSDALGELPAGRIATEGPQVAEIAKILEDLSDAPGVDRTLLEALYRTALAGGSTAQVRRKEVVRVERPSTPNVGRHVAELERLLVREAFRVWHQTRV